MQVTDVGMVALAGLLELQVLNLGLCCYITDMGIELLVESLGSSLISLDIGGCNFVTDHGVGALTGLTRLEHLNIAGCLQVRHGKQMLA